MLGTLGRLAIRIITLALALWCAIYFVPGINLAMPPHTLVGDGHYDYYVVFLLAGAVLFMVQTTVGRCCGSSASPSQSSPSGCFSW